MLIVLSPAKSLDFENKAPIKQASEPIFKKETQSLSQNLKKMSAEDLKELMSLSDNLAQLNHERYQNWQKEPTEEQAKAALFAFQGDVYQGLQAESFSPAEVEFAQKHLRILSGLYGILKPLDPIQPYRLEMGTKLRMNGHSDLYKFWGNKITQQINQELAEMSSSTLVNLASKEYFKSVKSKELKGRVITPVFKEFRGDKYKIISFSAKKARGLMSAYAVKNQIENPEELKNFSEENYSYDDKLSSENEWVFTR